jgi:hypothetical protein
MGGSPLRIRFELLGGFYLDALRAAAIYEKPLVARFVLGRFITEMLPIILLE